MTKQEFKEARERLGLTQRELGDALGLDSQTISRLERGEHGIKETTAMALRSLLPDNLRDNLDKPRHKPGQKPGRGRSGTVRRGHQ